MNGKNVNDLTGSIVMVLDAENISTWVLWEKCVSFAAIVEKRTDMKTIE